MQSLFQTLSSLSIDAEAFSLLARISSSVLRVVPLEEPSTNSGGVGSAGDAGKNGDPEIGDGDDDSTKQY